jgi:lipopolysaccharide/colanic/teichoic acid biosynthesis glycosyltransferase
MAAAVATSTADAVVLDEQSFHRMIAVERRRTERSHTPFLLVLLDTGTSAPSQRNGKDLGKIISVLLATTRETDVAGWYKDNSVIGLMFTEIPVEARNGIISTMLTRISATLSKKLSLEQFNEISISFYLFPEDWHQEIPRKANTKVLYPDLAKRDHARKFRRMLKRAMDIVGSLIVLILAFPVFAIVALAVKLTSHGPILFRQQRVGQYGVPFPLLKFRSMHADSSCSTHKEYVLQLIAGVAERKPSNGNGTGVYKLTSDSRITTVGAFLRRTSLDELPQFINVLRGEMSLVGPRPPIDYEVERYDLWHRRRLMEAKPGITGLWQVNGRNRIPFDEMVRLDLMYAKSWSPWLDVRILARTPRAVVQGAH